MTDKHNHYVRRGHKGIRGWFTRTNAEMFATLMAAQTVRGERGGLVEIGVHHGRSYLVLNLAAQEGEIALAIDVFEEQHFNLDGSGRGDRQIFETTVSRLGRPDRLRILQGSSLDVTPEQILSITGPVRFFSIDGGHWHEATVNDLDLAAATAAPCGVVALDDFGNADFPEVTHLGLIAAAGSDPGAYIRREVVNRIGVWLRRRGVPWIALWARENYEGPGREHVHLLMHLPRSHLGAFRAAVRRWWPEPISDLRSIYNVRGVVGYISKQMSPQAHFAVRRQIQRERACRRTGARAAPVLGRRLGISKALRELVEGPHEMNLQTPIQQTREA